MVGFAMSIVEEARAEAGQNLVVDEETGQREMRIEGAVQQI